MTDVNEIEGMPEPPEGFRWKLEVRYGVHFRVVAVRKSWPHLKMKDVEGIVLYQLRHRGSPPPECLIDGAHRLLRELSEIEEDRRRREALNAYL